MLVYCAGPPLVLQGKATMAMSNALGSNVFNVLIGLGVPYWIVQAVRGHPADVCPSVAYTPITHTFSDQQRL